MRIFVYEFVTGGGWYSLSPTQPPSGSLLREGEAMLRAAAADFAALPHCEVVVMRDARLPELVTPNVETISVSSLIDERYAFERLVQETDGVLLIAPEFDRHLFLRAQTVEKRGGRLLSPDSRFIALTGDKWCSYLQLHTAGVPQPHTHLVKSRTSLPSIFSYPLVLKPVDGCGSLGVQYLSTPQTPIDWREFSGEDALVQDYRVGLAASLAVISGPTETVLLPGGKQHLSREERFQYQGGAFPLHPVLQQRAQQLVEQCVAALPRTVGYFSIDLLLCELPEHDCIIEINPRLTTSYIGLRSLCKNNLALAMWNAAQGVAIELDWSHDALMFTADGNVFNPAESG